MGCPEQTRPGGQNQEPNSDCSEKARTQPNTAQDQAPNAVASSQQRLSPDDCQNGRSVFHQPPACPTPHLPSATRCVRFPPSIQVLLAQLASKAILGKRLGRHLLPRFQRKIAMTQELGRQNSQFVRDVNGAVRAPEHNSRICRSAPDPYRPGHGAGRP